MKEIEKPKLKPNLNARPLAITNDTMSNISKQIEAFHKLKEEVKEEFE